jgi:tetratricopeptide (TPR) repeat protein
MPPMYLNRDYKPRRRSKGAWRLWPLYLLILVAILVYEQWDGRDSEGSWLFQSMRGPTPTATLGAVNFLADAQTAQITGDFDGSLEALARVVALDPSNADAFIELSRLHLIFQDIPKALEEAQRAFELAPDDPEALNTLARALDWSGDYEQALDRALDSLDIDAENATTLAVLAEIYTDVGSWETADTYINQALAVDPRNVLALRNKGYLLERQGAYTEAVAAYQQAVEVAPNRFDLYIEKARQYRVGLEDFEAAIAAYQEAVNVYRSAITLDALGDGQYIAGDFLSAVRTLREAVDLDPTYAPAQVHMGMALFSRRNYEDSAAAFEVGLPVLGESARVEQFYRAGMANVLKDPPNCQRAYHWFDKVLERDEGNADAIEGKGFCVENATPTPEGN